MIIIVDLAKEANCNHVTIRQWIKKNNIQMEVVKASNGKNVQAISDEDACTFINHWNETTNLPEGFITVAEVAKINNIDRKTVRRWILQNNIENLTYRTSKSPPTRIIKLSDSLLFTQMYNNPNVVTVVDILKEFNTDWRVIRRWMKRNNCTFVKQLSTVGGRSKLALIKSDADQLEKYLMGMKSDGFFYLIQPVPEFNLNRIKLGFSKKPSRRLKEHRCICPNAIFVKKWKCKKEDETPVRQEATLGCVQLFTNINNKRTVTEVFDCEDYKIVLERLDKIFES